MSKIHTGYAVMGIFMALTLTLTWNFVQMLDFKKISCCIELADPFTLLIISFSINILLVLLFVATLFPEKEAVASNAP